MSRCHRPEAGTVINRQTIVKPIGAVVYHPE